MEFIDKTKRAGEAEDIVKSFLNNFIDKEEDYPEDLYDAFSRDKNAKEEKYRDLLLSILKEEQQNRCCYCMRKLDGETWEHIIPDNTNNKSEFDSYLDTEIVLNDTNVCFSNDFINGKIKEFPPFPHTIAYHNLILSCASSSHCNNFRGSKRIKPLVLYSSINTDIEYKANGYAHWKKETEDIPTLEKLGLNDDTLKMIRRIWFFANKEKIDLLSLSKEKRSDFLYQLIFEVEKKEEDVLLKFENDREWELLKQYDYFAHTN